MPLWNEVAAALSSAVANRGQIVLTNLTPGAYEFSRERTLRAGVWQTWPCDRRTIVLEPGQTQQVNLVRQTGQRLRGEVTGLEKTQATNGCLFVRSENDTNVMSWVALCFDALTFGKDGLFQTALLEPGAYTVLAEVYEPEVNTGVIRSGLRLPDYVGTAKVTITTNAAPPPVKIELHPTDTAPKAPAPAPVPTPAPAPAPARAPGPAPQPPPPARSAPQVGIPTASSTSEPSTLSAFVSQVVDDETGAAIGNYRVQAGVTNAQQPGGFDWSFVAQAQTGNWDGSGLEAGSRRRFGAFWRRTTFRKQCRSKRPPPPVKPTRRRCA